MRQLQSVFLNNISLSINDQLSQNLIQMKKQFQFAFDFMFTYSQNQTYYVVVDSKINNMSNRMTALKNKITTKMNKNSSTTFAEETEEQRDIFYPNLFLENLYSSFEVHNRKIELWSLNNGNDIMNRILLNPQELIQIQKFSINRQPINSSTFCKSENEFALPYIGILEKHSKITQKFKKTSVIHAISKKIRASYQKNGNCSRIYNISDECFRFATVFRSRFFNVPKRTQELNNNRTITPHSTTTFPHTQMDNIEVPQNAEELQQHLDVCDPYNGYVLFVAFEDYFIEEMKQIYENDSIDIINIISDGLYSITNCPYILAFRIEILSKISDVNNLIDIITPIGSLDINEQKTIKLEFKNKSKLLNKPKKRKRDDQESNDDQEFNDDNDDDDDYDRPSKRRFIDNDDDEIENTIANMRFQNPNQQDIQGHF